MQKETPLLNKFNALGPVNNSLVFGNINTGFSILLPDYVFHLQYRLHRQAAGIGTQQTRTGCKKTFPQEDR